MKLIHLSDLHIGKRVNDFSMLEDQEFILKEILQIATDVQPDAVMIAGDVYDKTIPTAEAVQLFDKFLTKLADQNLPVFLVSGNHDSPERVAFGAHLFAASKIYISAVFDGTVQCVTMHDQFGEVNIYMIPFIKPIHVRKYYPDAQIATFHDAFKVVIQNMHVDETKRNVLIAHQFFTGALRSDSEEMSVGGLDNIDAEILNVFDYVALGHIHRPQKVGRETIRYCGTPLKYSFSEVRDQKSVTVVTMNEKENIQVDTIPLHPRHDMRKVKGSYDELTLKSSYQNTAVDDYLHVTLTDEEDVLDAIGKLRSIYPNIMKLEYDNVRTRNQKKIEVDQQAEEKSPKELVSEFYQIQNDQELSSEQFKYVSKLIEQIWEG